MNMGKWDMAIFKSVFWPAFLILVYAVYEIGIPEDLDSLAGLGMFSLLFLGVYLVFSIIGWLLFGLPIHWLICRYGSGSYFLYIGAAILFTLGVYCLAGVAEAAFIYGFVALIQALIFKYYVHKQPQT
jgi:hypothetical protein